MPHSELVELLMKQGPSFFPAVLLGLAGVALLLERLLPVRRLRGVLVLLAWACLAALTGFLALNTLLRLWCALDGCVPGFRLPLVLTWKTFAFLFLVNVVAILFRPIERRLAGIGMGGRRRSLALAGATLSGLGLLALFVFVLPSDGLGSNRWGYRRLFPKNQQISFDPKNGEVPRVYVGTNEDSYRDDPWIVPAPDDGVERAVLVGDSTVVGLSIPDKVDQLDTLLEQRLSVSGETAWEVWNVASAPASLRYFAEVIPRVAPDAGAGYAILFVSCHHDVYFLDEQLALGDKPAWFYPAAHAVAVEVDIRRVSSKPWPPYLDEASNIDIRAAHVRAFRDLVAYAARNEMYLVVWEAEGPCDFFDAFRDEASVTFRNHSHTGRRSAGSLYEDATLGYRFTGHLTPRGMALVADTLAPALQKAYELGRSRDGTRSGP